MVVIVNRLLLFFKPKIYLANRPFGETFPIHRWYLFQFAIVGHHLFWPYFHHFTVLSLTFFQLFDQ